MNYTRNSLYETITIPQISNFFKQKVYKKTTTFLLEGYELLWKIGV